MIPKKNPTTSNPVAPTATETDEFAICWACLEPTPMPSMATLGDGATIPVCRSCWLKMTIFERVQCANTVMSSTITSELAHQLAEFGAAVNEQVRADLGQSLPGWLKGSKN